MITTRQILESHPITSLRRHIRETNMRGYSKMTKPELIDHMMINQSRFAHVQPYVKPPKVPRVAKPKVEKSKVVKPKRSFFLDPSLETPRPIRPKPAPRPISQIEKSNARKDAKLLKKLQNINTPMTDEMLLKMLQKPVNQKPKIKKKTKWNRLAYLS